MLVYRGKKEAPRREGSKWRNMANRAPEHTTVVGGVQAVRGEKQWRGRPAQEGPPTNASVRARQAGTGEGGKA